MSWIWAALMPHPPIIIPDIGGGREKEAKATVDGVTALTQRLKCVDTPDRILLLSPHQPYAVGAFNINGARVVRGSFAPFGVPSIVFDLRTPVVEAEALHAFLGSRGVPAALGEAHDLTRDQGSMVPLYYLENTYDGLPQIVLSNPIGLDRNQALKLGGALASFKDDHAWGLLASGDLSHRLKPGAPAGFSPKGAKFDEAVVQSLSTRDPAPLLSMSPRDIDEAGECGLRSMLVMLGMCRAFRGHIDVLSYEGPFGVGYCNAVWTRG